MSSFSLINKDRCIEALKYNIKIRKWKEHENQDPYSITPNLFESIISMDCLPNTPNLVISSANLNDGLPEMLAADKFEQSRSARQTPKIIYQARWMDPKYSSNPPKSQQSQQSQQSPKSPGLLSKFSRLFNGNKRYNHIKDGGSNTKKFKSRNNHGRRTLRRTRRR